MDYRPARTRTVRPIALVLIIIAACGTSTPETEPPPLPFGSEPTGALIHFNVPIDTANTAHEPRNVLDRASVSPGEHRFTWTSVPEAERYAFVANEIGTAQPDRAVVEFQTYLLQWVDEPALDVELVDRFDDGLPLALAVQVFAFDGDELIGMSDMWAIVVES